MLKILLASLSLALLPIATQAQDSAPFMGFWRNQSGIVVIQIIATGKGLEGIIRQQNEQPSLVGKSLITDLHFDPGSGEWRGTVNRLQKGDTKAITLEAVDKFHLVLTGKVGIFSRPIVWTRTSNPAATATPTPKN